MPLLKVDSSQPQVLFNMLKEMNIAEGTEFQVEKEEDGTIHLKPTGYLSFEEQKRRLMQLANFEILEDDSEQLNKTIKEARTTSEMMPID